MRTKKKLFAAALAICMLSTISFSTLAWFNATESVTNRFMVATTGSGTGHDKEDKIFSLDLWECVDEAGNKVSYRQDGLTGWDYKDVLPGVKYIKQPTVENTGSYDQYIRIIVEISDAAAWHSAVGRDYAFENCFVGFSEDMWTHIGVNYFPVDDKIVVVAYYDGVLEPGKTLTPFSAVKIPESLTQDQAAAFEGGFSINVKAHAVQTKNVGNSAYEAFKTVAWSSLEEYK